MKFLVKDTPIRKNGKTYRVGEEFPYSDKDKKLLWNLTEVIEIPKDNSSTDGNKVAQSPSTDGKKKPATKKKTVAKQSPSTDGKKK